MGNFPRLDMSQIEQCIPCPSQLHSFMQAHPTPECTHWALSGPRISPKTLQKLSPTPLAIPTTRQPTSRSNLPRIPTRLCKAPRPKCTGHRAIAPSWNIHSRMAMQQSPPPVSGVSADPALISANDLQRPWANGHSLVAGRRSVVATHTSSDHLERSRTRHTCLQSMNDPLYSKARHSVEASAPIHASRHALYSPRNGGYHGSQPS
jgi:hypothetical protein